ncbi:MAG: hypothetical protein WDN06_20610 [Asticcacaulis sp.]
MKTLRSVKTLVGIGVALAAFASSGSWAFTTHYSIDRTWYNYGDPDYVVGHTFVGCDGSTSSWGVVGDYPVVVRTPCD